LYLKLPQLVILSNMKTTITYCGVDKKKELLHQLFQFLRLAVEIKPALILELEQSVSSNY
jgi:hypothetical protein